MIDNAKHLTLSVKSINLTGLDKLELVLPSDNETCYIPSLVALETPANRCYSFALRTTNAFTTQFCDVLFKEEK